MESHCGRSWPSWLDVVVVLGASSGESNVDRKLEAQEKRSRDNETTEMPPFKFSYSKMCFYSITLL